MSSIQLLPEVQAFLARQHGHYIDGKAVASSGERIEIINPATGGTIASIAAATPADIEAAVASSRRAFSTEWASTSPDARACVLLRLADLFIQQPGRL